MKTRFALLVVASLCFLAGGALAQAMPDDWGVEMATGTVVSASGSSFVITTDNGVERSFVTSETTMMPLTTLVAGDRVSVKFRSIDATRLEAVDVSVVDSEPGTPVAGIPRAAPASHDLPATASATLLLAFLFTVVLAGALAFRATRLLQ
jgi:hypothetical protein